MRRADRRRSGFSLLELMFAMVILAGGLLAMLMVQMQALQQGRYGRHTSEAMQLARDQMELFMRLPWGAAAVQPAAWTVPAPVGVNVQNEDGAQTQQVFNVRWRITAAGFNPSLRTVDVDVTWNEQTANPGFQRRYVLTSSKVDES
jgi:type IV pilus assembly protein PilV